MPPIVHILVVLILIGLALYLVNQFPIDNVIKNIIRAVALIAVVLFLLDSFTGSHYLAFIHA